MKFQFGRISFLVAGLETLHNVAMLSGYYVRPAQAYINGLSAHQSEFVGEFGETDRWSIEPSERKNTLKNSATTRKPQTALDSYLALMGPLLKTLGISPMSKILSAPEIKELVIRKFLALEDEFNNCFTETASIRTEKFSELISRFNEGRLVERGRELNASNPAAIAVRGMILYRDASSNQIDIEKLIWSVALIGWASFSLSESKKCSFCPRRTTPGGKYCADHGQGAISVSGRTRSRQASAYRVGKLAYLLAREKGLVDRPVIDLQARQIGPWNLETPVTNVSNAMRMHEILQPADLSWDKGCNRRIRDALKRSPLVRELLDENLIFKRRYTYIVNAVRVKLQLFELEERLLPWVISAFEAWLECEAEVRRQVRGAGRKATKRVLDAIVMARQGKTRTEIAEELNVQQSTVTLWCKKSTDLASALAERDLRSLM